MIKHYCDICGKDIQDIKHAVRISSYFHNSLYNGPEYLFDEVCEKCDIAIFGCIQNLHKGAENDDNSRS